MIFSGFRCPRSGQLIQRPQPAAPGCCMLASSWVTESARAFPFLTQRYNATRGTAHHNTGVATDAARGAIITTTNSASPGQTITLWTTGLGADPADSDTTFSTAPHAVNTPLQSYIGGAPATILYQGSAGYPGVGQINLTGSLRLQ